MADTVYNWQPKLRDGFSNWTSKVVVLSGPSGADNVGTLQTVVGLDIPATPGKVYLSPRQTLGHAKQTEQAVQSWVEGQLTFILSEGPLRFDTVGRYILIADVDGNLLTFYEKAVLPIVGNSYVNTTSLQQSDRRITAIPDLAVGNQLEWTDAARATVNEDGTFSVDLVVTNFSVRAHDSSANEWGAFAFQTVQPLAGTAPLITTTLDEISVAAPFSQQLVATGDTPITWSATGLIAGFTLTSGGLLSGTVFSAGSFSFDVTATNAFGNNVRTYSGQVTGEGTAPTMEPYTLPPLIVDSMFSHTFIATGSPTPYFELTAGTIPDGLVLDPNGLLEGTPTTEGAYDFTISAVNENGTAGIQETGYVYAVVAVTTAALNTLTKGASFSQQLSAAGTAPITWSSPDASNYGLSLSASGLLTGTPLVDGTYHIDVEGENAVSSGFAAFDGQILSAPVITTTSLGSVYLGVAFSLRVQSTGILAPTFTLTAGSLPAGLSLASDGTISGTPTTLGAYSFTLTATNATGSDPQAYSGAVEDAPPVSEDATLSEAIIVVTGGPSVNEGLFSYFGGAGTTLKDRERAWLEGKTAVRGTNEDMWHDYLYNVRGYAGSRNDMELRFWRDGGAAAPASVVTKGYTAVWNQFAASACGYRLSPAGGSLSPDNLFAGGTIAQLAVTDNDFLYLLPSGGVQFPDIAPGFVWFTFSDDEVDTIALEWDTIDRYVALVPGAYVTAQGNIGIPVRVRLSGDVP
jgi:hypothetical protein